MESIIEMFSGLNTQTRADLLARLFTKNSELISAKRNNSYNVEIPSLPSQNNEIQNQNNLNLNNQSQDQSNLPLKKSKKMIEKLLLKNQIIVNQR